MTSPLQDLRNDRKIRGQKLPYDQIAFLLVKPPSRVISSHQIKNRKEHSELLKKAKEKKYVVYYADVKQRDGKFFAVQPWIVDFESVDNLYGPVEELDRPKKPESKPKKEKLKPKKEKLKLKDDDDEDVITHLKKTREVEDTDEIRCPFCNKKMSSTPGRTLHVKSKHPDKLTEYKKMK